MSKSKMIVKSYKEFYIVKYNGKSTYDVVNPHNGKTSGCQIWAGREVAYNTGNLPSG